MDLQSRIALPLSIVWHENRRSYLSFRKTKQGIFVRLHRLFQEVPSSVLDALALYILKQDAQARAILRQAVYFYFSTMRAPATLGKTQGKVYDLQLIYEELKAQYFTQDYSVAIGWSKISSKKTLGTYDCYRNQIKISSSLDHENIPPYFLAFVVYHEMLHAVCKPSVTMQGQIRPHTAEFKKKEKAYAQYAEAKAWEKKWSIRYGRT